MLVCVFGGAGHVGNAFMLDAAGASIQRGSWWGRGREGGGLLKSGGGGGKEWRWWRAKERGG